MSEQNNQREFDDSLLSAYVDGELTADERAAVEARLAEDPQARQLVADLETVSARVRSLPRAEVAGDIRAAVMDQIAESTSALPPSNLSMPRRLLWPLLATAALVMLMIYQTEVKEDEIEVAQNDRLELANGREEAKEDSFERAIPEVKAFDESAESVASSPPAVRDGASAERLAGAPSEERLGLEQEVAADAAVPMTAGAVGGAVAMESNVGLVHITLTDLRTGADHFERLLVSNGIQIVDEQEESENSPLASSESTTARRDSNLFADSRAGGFGGTSTSDLGEADSASDSNADKTARPEPEMVLVEAPAEQLGKLLLACNQDTEAIESVTIDEPTDASGGKRPEPLQQYRQYEKSSRDQQAKQKMAITPEQQGVIAVLNSLNFEQDSPSSGTDSAGPEQSQAWATKLRSGQSPDEIRQLEGQVQSRLNQAYAFKQRKLAKEESAPPQQMRVLFFLHPSTPVEK